MFFLKKYIHLALFILLLLSAGAFAIAQIARHDKDAAQEQTGEDGEAAVAADPWSEIDKLVHTYYQQGGITCKGAVKLIDGNKDGDKVLEKQDLEYTISGANYYYSLGAIEFINNNKYIIVADNNNKTVTLSGNGDSRNSSAFFDLNDFKNKIEAAKADVKLTSLKEYRILTVDNIQDPAIQGYRIYYNPATYEIAKIVIGMLRPFSLDDAQESDGAPAKSQNTAAEGTTAFTYYLEIDYSEIKALSLTAAEFRPESKFIQFNDGQVALTEPYKDYELINTTE